MRLNRYDSEIYREQFDLVEQRFRLLIGDLAAARKLIADGLAFIHAPHADSKLVLLDSGFFSEELLQAMICGGQPFKTGPVHYIWSRLRDREIVVHATGHMPCAFVDHTLMTTLLLEHLQADTFQNVFAPPSALLRRYADAVVSIDVHTASDGMARGTGFFLSSDFNRPVVLITCRHNVDEDKDIEIKRIVTASGQEVSYGRPRYHPTEDIAVIPALEFKAPELVFHLRDGVEVFDEVYSLGFPLVPCARPGVLGHRGEVNGCVDLYIGGSKVLLISNLVSPGSSGGPVLDRDGFCIGMSVKWLEGEWEGGKARFSAVLPAALLKAWILSNTPN